MTRKRLAISAFVALAGAVVALSWFLFAAPLYLLMPHAPRNTDALFGDELAIVAHRGVSGEAPENTLAAFREARRQKTWIELDVTLCKTGEVIVIHDDTVDRTTDGTGVVEDMTIQELRKLDAGAWFGGEFTHEKLPTLSEVLAVIGPDTIIDIELKTDDDKKSLPLAVAKVIERAKRADSVFVSSFDPFMLEQLRFASPEIYRAQLVGSYEDSDLAFYEKRALRNLAFTAKVQPDLILWEHTVLGPEVIERLQGEGYRVLAWTVDEPADIQRLKDQGIDGILSNFPRRVK